ncbi:MAG: hypothetical protein U9Q92_06600 [archaeon]|nr:hypothetical protein [archaeon]
MSSYGLTLEDTRKFVSGLLLKEVKDVITGCGLYIERAYIPLALGNKYIIEAKGLKGEYCQIILCSYYTFYNEYLIREGGLEDGHSYTSPISCTDDFLKKYLEIVSCKLPDFDGLFGGAIVKTSDLHDELQYTDVHKYKQVNELIEGWNIEAVNDYTNPFWYKIVAGQFGAESASNPLDEKSLKEAISHILKFGEFIDVLIDKKYEWGELPEEYIDWLVERAISQ